MWSRNIFTIVSILILLTSFGYGRYGEGMIYLPILIVGGIIFITIVAVIVLIVWYGIKMMMPIYNLLGFSFFKSLLLSMVTLYLIYRFFGSEIWYYLSKISMYLAMRMFGVI